jgi:hypothetical protein
MEIAMATVLRLLLVGAPLLCTSGCSWLPWLGRNLVGTPLEVVESCYFDTSMYLRAHKAWRDTMASCPDQKSSAAYADGFCHGFVDYVKRGGSGEPPAMPPMCYRYPVLRTPAQQQEIDDWFAGFRHGSLVALQQGWRDGVIVPIGRPPDIASAGFKQEVVPTTSPQPEPAVPPALPFEQLPPPRREPEPVPPPAPQPAPQPAPLMEFMPTADPLRAAPPVWRVAGAGAGLP